VVDRSSDWVSAEVSNGPLAGRTLHQLVEEFGADLLGDVQPVGPHKQFPILIKFLDAKEDLSVQVHPDGNYAAANAGAHLKTEAWYVVQHDPNARIYKGLRPGTTRDAFARSIEQGTCEDLLTAIPVKEGQCFFLPSGTVHALGAGILAAEVQTPSDTTFRVYDFNRLENGKPRTLHIDQALACIDFSGAPEPKQPRTHVAGFFTTVTRLCTSEFFKIEKVRFSEGVDERVPYDEPVVWMMLEGEAHVRVDGVKQPTHFKRGETVLLPAKMKNPTIKTMKDCVWLEVTFPTKPELG
jgi:mannose-6-phosphate isomerase